MALLDDLFQNNSGGGLLDFLRQNAISQQMAGGLASDQAQYAPAQYAPMAQAMAQAPQQPSPPIQQSRPVAAPQVAGPGSFSDRWNGLLNTPSPLDNAQWPQGPNGAPSQAPQPDPAAIPQNAQFAQGQLPQRAPQQEEPQELPPAFGGTSYLERLNAGGGLIGSMLGDTSQQKNLTAQYHALRQALVANGETKQAAASKAMIAVMNPEAAKTVIPELFTNKTELKMVKDALGAEHPMSWNPREQTLKPVGANGEMTGNSVSGSPSLLAPGVQQFNPSLSGDDYLKQFGPEVQAAVKAYINGDVMPSGNPRTQAIATKAKEIAQKYGQDMGIPVSDALFSEKRKYRTELGTNSPNSAGGQAKAFNQGISHLTSLADNLEKLDNSNGVLGINTPLTAKIANSYSQATSNQQSAISDEAKSLGQTVAGEVGKLFSGSAGGGVHERELTRERFDTVKSKPQLAAALRATLETMDGGLKALEQRRDAVMGPNSGIELVNEATKANIAKIQGAIDRLEGKAAPASKPASGNIPSGWSVKVR